MGPHDSMDEFCSENPAGTVVNCFRWEPAEAGPQNAMFWLNIGFHGKQRLIHGGPLCTMEDRFETTLSSVTKDIRAGGKVLAHCKAGHIRSGAFAIACIFMLGPRMRLTGAIDEYLSKSQHLSSYAVRSVKKLTETLHFDVWLNSLRGTLVHDDGRPRPNASGSSGPSGRDLPPIARSRSAGGPQVDRRRRQRSRSRSPRDDQPEVPWRRRSHRAGQGDIALMDSRSPGNRSERPERATQQSSRHEPWTCIKCQSPISADLLHCFCGARRPLTQVFEQGDWICPECGHHNFKSRSDCNWSHCPTRRHRRR